MEDSNFTIPDGRTRLFIKNVGPKNVDAVVAKLNLVSPDSKLVFMSNTNDTRYDAYGVMRPITMASN